MKTRKVIALLLPFFVFGLLFSLDAQNITVTKPVAGSHFCNRGDNPGPNIVWTKSGSMTEQVKIELFDSNGINKVMDIVASTSNDGDHYWNLGSAAMVPPGSYTLRVTTMDNQVSGKSAVFVMEACNNSGAMSFIAPQNGAKLLTGSACKIRWQVANPPPYHNAYRTARLTLVPTEQPPSSGFGNVGTPPLEQNEFDWFIPVSTPPGSYNLWLFTVSGDKSAKVKFTIENGVQISAMINWKDLLKTVTVIRWQETATNAVRELDLSGLQAALSQGQEKVRIELMNGTQLIADLGQFGPGVAANIRQRVTFPTSQGNDPTTGKPRQKSKAEDYQLRLKNMSGELMHTHPVKLEKAGG